MCETFLSSHGIIPAGPVVGFLPCLLCSFIYLSIEIRIGLCHVQVRSSRAFLNAGRNGP